MYNKLYLLSLLSMTMLLAPNISHAQGPLAPSGAPGPTMLTLDQIEPRTPISALPYTISTSGSFFLTTNLVGTAGTNGITVNADNVTIDLRGFSLDGVSGSLDGIFVNSLYKNMTVKNGFIRKWDGYGIYAESVRTVLRGLTVTTNEWNGAYLGGSSLVTDCIFSENVSRGLTTGDGATVKNCIANNNGSIGFSIGADAVVQGCVANNNASAGYMIGNYSVVQGCGATGNGGDGFSIALGGSIEQCVAAQNTVHGFDVENGSKIVNCTAYGNTIDGINGHLSLSLLVKDCVAYSNGDDGIDVYFSSEVRDCVVRGNGDDGIEVDHSCFVVGNDCSFNTAAANSAGIHVIAVDNRIDGNNLIRNDTGLLVDLAGNFIVRNSASGSNITNYDITGTQTIGPIETATGTITNMNPWTNFSF